MSKIFEIFGLPVSLQTNESTLHRKTRVCPFMNRPCDGGGNRHASNIDLNSNRELKALFGEATKIPSGICSIQTNENQSPWIVCPKRLLALDVDDNTKKDSQSTVIDYLVNVLSFPQNTKLGIWPELKLRLKAHDNLESSAQTFNYTFDYLIMRLGDLSKDEFLKKVPGEWSQWRKLLLDAGYSVKSLGQTEVIENFPIDRPCIIEIMTSSTSGGNKNKRTTVPLAFEDALLGKQHNAPGINKRQVWARMVSQLIVKSEVALHWGGKTVWIIQDNLADYISETTALKLDHFISTEPHEVNILSFGFGQAPSKDGIYPLTFKQFFAGPISSSSFGAKPSFSDLIRASFTPRIEDLFVALSKKSPSSYWVT